MLTERLLNEFCSPTLRDFWIYSVYENRATFGEHHNLIPRLRVGDQKFKYFRISSEKKDFSTDKRSTVKLDQREISRYIKVSETNYIYNEAMR